MDDQGTGVPRRFVNNDGLFFAARGHRGTQPGTDVPGDKKPKRVPDKSIKMRVAEVRSCPHLCLRSTRAIRTRPSAPGAWVNIDAPVPRRGETAFLILSTFASSASARASIVCGPPALIAWA